jgi:hypothetical protein
MKESGIQGQIQGRNFEIRIFNGLVIEKARKRRHARSQARKMIEKISYNGTRMSSGSCEVARAKKFSYLLHSLKKYGNFNGYNG